MRQLKPLMRSLVIWEENSKTRVCFVENSIVTQCERKLMKEPNEHHFSLNKLPTKEVFFLAFYLFIFFLKAGEHTLQPQGDMADEATPSYSPLDLTH